MDLFVIFGLGLLVCLVPFALYLMYLANLNDHRPPTVIPGPWDLTTVFLGLSGFLLVSGPLVIALLDSALRTSLVSSRFNINGVPGRVTQAWSLIAFGYWVIVAGLLWLCIRRRRAWTAIYNIDVGSASAAIVSLLESKNYEVRCENGLIHFRTPVLDTVPGTSLSNGQWSSIQLVLFPGTNHANIRWSGKHEAIRTEIEPLLSIALDKYGSPERSIARWLFPASMMLIILLIFIMAMIVLLIWFPG